MSKSYEITTIKDLMEVVTEENIELLKSDICVFLESVLVIRKLNPLINQKPKFTWNDDGVEGVKSIHFEVKKKAS